MKIKILIIISFIVNSLSYGQTWPKYYGDLNRDDFSYDITENYDKGYYILGGYESSSGYPKYTWLIKTDINGNFFWDKILKCDGFVKSFAFEPSNDKGLIISGSIILNNIGLNSHPLVVKLNSCGEKEWCKVFAESPNAYPVAIDVKETNNGDIVLIVNMYGENPYETMHLFKLNEFGEVLWKEPFCSAYNHPMGSQPLGNSLLITSDQKYLISGSVYWKNPWEPGSTTYIIRPLFVMVDSEGDEEWVLPYGLNDTLYGTAKNTIELNNGEFLSTGSDWAASNYIQPLFMKFDTMGMEKSSISFTPDNFDDNMVEGAFTEMTQIDSSYFVQGLFEFQPGDVYKTCTYNIDTGFFGSQLQINSNYYINDYGEYNLEKTFDKKVIHLSTSSFEGDQQIQFSKLNLNLEIDSAYSGIYNYDSLCIPGPPQSGIISLDTCDIVVGIEIPSPSVYYSHLKTIPISAYPNPAKDKVIFSLENSIHHRNIVLSCLNLMGRELFNSSIIPGQIETHVNIKDWQPGMYMAIVYSNDIPVGRCKFVVQ